MENYMYMTTFQECRFRKRAIGSLWQNNFRLTQVLSPFNNLETDLLLSWNATSVTFYFKKWRLVRQCFDKLLDSFIDGRSLFLAFSFKKSKENVMFVGASLINLGQYLMLIKLYILS